MHPDKNQHPADEPSVLPHQQTNIENRIDLKSTNWLMRLTRRKQTSSSDTCSSFTSIPTTKSTRSQKLSIVNVFNKYLKIGSKQSFHIDRTPSEVQDAVLPAVLDSPTVSTDICLQQTNTYCQSGAQSSSDQNIQIWLKSMSVEDATIYEAKIAMNPKGWYRGNMSRDLAQKKLQGQPDGSFLVRDSQTSGCHFTLSFRSVGITLHYRIENLDGMW